MKLKALTTAMILAALPTAGAFAAALDRSGQSISAFLQPGNYFEAGISVLDPDVSGKDISGNDASDMAGDYYFPNAALKLQLTDHFSFGLLYDQPYGAEAEYTGDNNFVAKQSDRLLPSATSPTLGQAGLGNVITGGTAVEVDTQNLNFILGYQPTANWNLYGGAVYQTVKGNVKLRGSAYSLYNGYDADIKETGDFGWLAGIAYQIPEIALKASLTYRSEIEHNAEVNENIPIVNLVAANPTLLFGALGITDPATQQAIGQKLAALGGNGKTDITTPQSVNLDFQTGIMANTVAFANLRWVNWKDFSIQPYKFGLVSQAAGQLLPQLNKPNGFNLVDYSDDQWSANVGLGRKLNEQWAGNVSVGWDSGAGNPVTTLGPVEGFWNVGLGVQYSPTPATFIAGGVKYFWLGDADAQTGAHSAAGTFSDNDALAYGLKLGYRF
jgi:long-chain fatty acid transport protein